MKLSGLITRLQELEEEYGPDIEVGIYGQEFKEPLTDISVGYLMPWSNDGEWFVWGHPNQESDSKVLLVS